MSDLDAEYLRNAAFNSFLKEMSSCVHLVSGFLQNPCMDVLERIELPIWKTGRKMCIKWKFRGRVIAGVLVFMHVCLCPLAWRGLGEWRCCWREERRGRCCDTLLTVTQTLDSSCREVVAQKLLIFLHQISFSLCTFNMCKKIPTLKIEFATG